MADLQILDLILFAIGTFAAAFTTTLVAFFLAEIGDKTQIATIRPRCAVRAVLSGRSRHDPWHDAGEHPGRRHWGQDRR
jgi:hypothetical protein